MVINLVNRELRLEEFINHEGKYLFKIEKLEELAHTMNGDAKFKLHFKGVEVGKKEPIYLYNEMFNFSDIGVKFIGKFVNSINAPLSSDSDLWIGRYVIATIKQDGTYEKDSKTYDNFKCVGWEYSAHNDKLTPIPEAKQDENNDTAINTEVPIIDLDNDEIPF